MKTQNKNKSKNINQKSGHTFAGWQDVPATMPARDVTVTGSFAINSYRLTLYLNDEVYHTEDVEFGTEVKVDDPEVPEGMQFDGWTDEIPETMPAHDVDIHGTYSEVSAIASIEIDVDSSVTVVNLSGHVLYRNARWGDIGLSLESGLYIINGEKVLIRK